MDGDREAEFRDFVLAQWHTLARTAFLLTGDRGDAEDLVQSALVRVHRHWSRIERTDAPYLYARRVMVNLHLSSWRRRRVSLLLAASPPERPAPDVTSAVDQREELLRACRTLPPRMRAVLVLRYFEDLPEAEVARVLGISVGSVKSQTSRGLGRLRTALEAASSEPASSEPASSEPASSEPASSELAAGVSTVTPTVDGSLR